MKRILAIFLLIPFLMANSGMAVTVHYCGGKLSSVNLFSIDKHKCKCGKKAMKKDCCTDKTTFLKMKDDFAKTNQISFKFHIQSLLPPLIFPMGTALVSQFHNSGWTFYHPPPFKPKAPIYLLDRVFLI